MRDEVLAAPSETTGLSYRFRYRTPALIGPWRKSRLQAIRDALRARQARRDEADRNGVCWLVDGLIEESAAPAAWTAQR